MANRTTVKSNIVTKNVPTVTNAILTDMLNAELADNLKFREDVAVVQISNTSNITVDFTGRDRIDLTRTGGELYINVVGIADGEEVSLLITKTPEEFITWANVDDVTPMVYNVYSYGTVVYKIIRKGVDIYASALVNSILPASNNQTIDGTISNVFTTPASIQAKASTNAETITGTTTTKFVTPASLTAKKASYSELGIVKRANSTSVDQGESIDQGGSPLYVSPSELMGVTGNIKTSYFNIGDWNMVSTESKQVATSISLSKIRGIEVLILADGGASGEPFREGIYINSSGVVTLVRDASGAYVFDIFDQTSFNRGYIIIKYVR